MRASIAGQLKAAATRAGLVLHRSPGIVRLALVALYLVSVAQFYIPGFGFTALIMFEEERHQNEIPAVRETTHYHLYSYDGQFYAQMAVDPTLKDPAFDKALDTPPYRARRILFSWTAYLLGLGRPVWILQAYALQNVLFWLLLAWWLHRRLPGGDARSQAIWIGCLFCHGLLFSTVAALLDGPSLLLIVLAIASMERGRSLLGTAILGVSGLARETNLMALVALRDAWPLRPKGLLRLVGFALLALLPLALWIDYLRTIYLNEVLEGSGGLLLGFGMEFLRAWQAAWQQVATQGVAGFSMRPLLAMTAVTTQACWLAWDRDLRDPWWRVGILYAALMLTLTLPVWEGQPGAFTRVLLPMQVAFNFRIVNTRGFWPLFVLGNLSILPGLAWIGMPGVGRWL